MKLNDDARSIVGIGVVIFAILCLYAWLSAAGYRQPTANDISGITSELTEVRKELGEIRKALERMAEKK